MEAILLEQLRDIQRCDTRQCGFGVYACFFQLGRGAKTGKRLYSE